MKTLPSMNFKSKSRSRRRLLDPTVSAEHFKVSNGNNSCVHYILCESEHRAVPLYLYKMVTHNRYACAKEKTDVFKNYFKLLSLETNA